MKSIDPFSIQFELALKADRNTAKLRPYMLGAVCLILVLELALAVLILMSENTVPTIQALTGPLMFFTILVSSWLVNIRKTPQHFPSVFPS